MAAAWAYGLLIPVSAGGIGRNQKIRLLRAIHASCCALYTGSRVMKAVHEHRFGTSVFLKLLEISTIPFRTSGWRGTLQVSSPAARMLADTIRFHPIHSNDALVMTATGPRAHGLSSVDLSLGTKEK